MITLPPYLSPGDTIAITCPAGYMPLEKATACIETLQQWGYEVLVGKTLGGSSENYFSAPDDNRCDELQAMLDDKSVKAILFGRGGYGMGRIIDKLNFKKFKKHPKWVIGFSDITVMHCHLFTNYNIASLHAPMAAAFNDGEDNSFYIQTLRKAIAGEKQSYQCLTHSFNKKGKATGKLIGGNLALLAHVIGTASDFDTKDCILFLEDIGEYSYNIDRMLYQLKRSDKMKKLAGIIIGGFTDMKDTERPFGKTVDEIIHEILKDVDVPVCFNFPVSHGKENVSLKIGADYILNVGKERSTLKEI
ncbi:MAG: LD-carboxypeptidase [Ferruginibacter sp.]